MLKKFWREHAAELMRRAQITRMLTELPPGGATIHRIGTPPDLEPDSMAEEE